LFFFYHSNIGKEIVGIVKVIREAYPDPTDKSKKFVAVQVRFEKKLSQPVTLENIKKTKELKDLPLIKRIECGDNHSMCIDINDKLWVFGHNVFGQLGLGDTKTRYSPTLNESVHDIIDISSGKGHHTFIKTINNEIYCFGYSICLEEIPNNPKKTQPVQVLKNKEDIWDTTRGKSRRRSSSTCSRMLARTVNARVTHKCVKFGEV